MPTLGFLKKKRTKESTGSKDLSSTNSATSSTASPITPTSSRGLNGSIPSISSQSTAPFNPPQNPETRKLSRPISGGEQRPMTQGVTQQQQQQLYASSADTANAPVSSDQYNLPGINTLINPPQHDGAAQSYPSQMAANNNNNNDTGTSNGGLVANVQQIQAPREVARETKGKYSLSDFEILRTLGTGSFGRVHLVQSRHNQRFYAVKVLKKQQVVKMKQVEHTNDERKMLAEVKHPFLITLWGTFQDSKNLYMVMDFVEGGELFSLLRKSQVSRQIMKPDRQT